MDNICWHGLKCREYEEKLKKVKMKNKPIDHKEIRQFSRKHFTKIKNRENHMRKQRKTLFINLQTTLNKVNKDQHNFFMVNSQNGNDSILGKKYNPSRQRMMRERTAKKRQYESELKERITDKIRSMKKRSKVIPEQQHQSILIVDGTFPKIQRHKRVFAFGSSMVGRSVNLKRKKSKKSNELDFRRFQFRKEIGKKYLEELRDFHHQKRQNSSRKANRRVSSSRVSKSQSFRLRTNTLKSQSNRKNSSKAKVHVDLTNGANGVSSDIMANMAIIENRAETLKGLATEKSDFEEDLKMRTERSRRRDKENEGALTENIGRQRVPKSNFLKETQTNRVPNYLDEFKKSKIDFNLNYFAKSF